MPEKSEIDKIKDHIQILQGMKKDAEESKEKARERYERETINLSSLEYQIAEWECKLKIIEVKKVDSD